MKKIALFYLLFFGLLGLMAPGSYATTISGRVTSNATPVCNVLMSAEDINGQVVKAVYTDSSGNYVLDNLSAAVYSLFCFPGDAYAQPDMRTVSLVSTNSSVQDYALALCGKISGVAFQSDHQTPLAGVMILATKGDGGSASTANAQSGLDGSYTITGLAPGTYSVSASASGWGFTGQAGVNVTASNTTAGINFTGIKASISGTVRIASGGATVAGVTVFAIASGTGAMLGMATTDANGHYQISGLPGGSCDLYSGKTGYRGQKKAGVQATESGTTNQDIIAQTGQISGKVYYNSSALSGAEIGAVCLSSDLDPFLFYGETPILATSGADGSYQLPYLPAGTYRLYARKSGYATVFISDQTLAAGTSLSGIDCTITSNIAGSISGAVTGANGAPLTHGSVSLQKVGDSTFMMTAMVDSGGHYSIVSLPDGSYTVSTNVLGGYVQERSGVVGISGGQNVTGKDFSLTAETGSLSGTMRDASTGLVLADVYLEAFSPSTGCVAAAVSDSQGGYTIAPLGAATDYTVTAKKTGYCDGQSTVVSVLQNQNTPHVDFSLSH